MEDYEVTMTAQEPMIAYGTNSYSDVMYLIHTMRMTPEVKEKVGRRLLLEVTAEHLSRAFSRLDDLIALEKDWDGEGALPISRKAINNVKSVLLISNDEDWKEWMIGPDTNATLGLQSKTTGACVSIGDEEYSYYVDINGKELHGNHIKFTPDTFLQTLRKIS